MRDVTYTDDKGRKTLVRIPDDAPDEHAAYGILVGPPDLSGLGLPEQIEIRLSNALYDRRIYTFKDAKSHPQEVFAALQAALRVDVFAVVNIYANGDVNATRPPA